MIATLQRIINVYNDEISEATASRRLNLVRDALNKPKPKVITMDEFCTYYGIGITE